MERTGQISIDYLAGALIFFGSLIFLVSNVMTTLPAFSDAQQTDELRLTAWSISEVVMNDRGYWENATHQGSDWPEHLGDVEVLGVKAQTGLSKEKIDTLTALNQSRLRSALRTGKKVNVEFREVVDIDTHRTFQQGSAPSFLTEPSYPSHVAETVHYGAKRLEGSERFFLLTKNRNRGWYNRLRVSDDADFSTSELYNLTETQYIPVGDGTYVADAGNTDISEGNLLILWRNLGRTGDVPTESVQNIASVERYGVLKGNVVEVTFRVWE
ncbi:MAG: hypothetical protein SVW77_02220 [Candidatus Nanohaloarchaea archaeon]|nr:hypothetical protein [Candidatus Nanohaloarchaea archaeon]